MSIQLNSNGSQISSQSQLSSNGKPPIETIKAAPSIDPFVRNNRQLQLAENRGEHVTVADEQLIKAVERAAKVLAGPTTTVEMQVHKKTNEVIMKVVNKENGDVIREVPPEKMLDLVAKMMEFAGILIDERV